MQNDIEMPVRQAAAVYLKNSVNTDWQDKEADGTGVIAFSIHEQDRAMVRDSIVEAIVLTPETISSNLAICVFNIIKHDFPGRWTQVVDKISIYLQNRGKHINLFIIEKATELMFNRIITFIFKISTAGMALWSAYINWLRIMNTKRLMNEPH